MLSAKQSQEEKVKLDPAVIRDAFLVFMCDLLGGYTKFFNSQVQAPHDRWAHEGFDHPGWGSTRGADFGVGLWCAGEWRRHGRVCHLRGLRRAGKPLTLTHIQ